MAGVSMSAETETASKVNMKEIKWKEEEFTSSIRLNKTLPSILEKWNKTPSMDSEECSSVTEPSILGHLATTKCKVQKLLSSMEMETATKEGSRPIWSTDKAVATRILMEINMKGTSRLTRNTGKVNCRQLVWFIKGSSWMIKRVVSVISWILDRAMAYSNRDS